jgi:hypothetical protein
MVPSISGDLPYGVLWSRVGVDIQAVPLHMTMMIAGGEEAYYG